MKKEWINRDIFDIKFHKGESSSMRKIVSGKVVDIISNFERVLIEAGELGYKNLEISWGHIEGVDCYDIKADVLESDKEFEKRKKIEIEIEAKERALYEELKAKFERL